MTLSQYNIVGQKEEINFEKIINNSKLEYLTIKKFNITTKIMEILNTLPNLSKIWFIDCNIINKIKLKQIKNLTIENCKNVDNIIFDNNLEKIYIRNCKSFDIRKLAELKNLTTLELEYIYIENLNLIKQLKRLENLYLKEIDLTMVELEIPINLKKLVLNGSKVNNKKAFMESLKGKNLEVEFYDKNLPIG